MKSKKRFLIILTAMFLTLSGNLSLGGETAAGETTSTGTETEISIQPTVQQPAGTVKVALDDTLKVQPTKPDSLFYEADSIYFHYDTEQIYLYGSTKVNYDTSTILADSLQIDLKKDRAFSSGRTVMLDGDQILIGNEVFYDVNSQTGMIYAGASKIEKGYYYGDEIRRVDANVYDVDGGRFTTCEDPEPDFWFWAQKMRFYRGDKIVGKPVIAYVNHMPVFYFPFLTFSIKRGRHAGFLIPEPGYNTVDGKFVRDIAYFIPYKEYADATIGLDLMEKTGWMANLEGRYTKRYLYSGNFYTALQKSISDFATNTDYSIRANHHHELGDRATFDANIDYVSNKRIWEGSTDIDQSLAERVTSTISYRRPVLSSYLNAGATYSEDLVNNTASVSLPSVTYSLPTRPVYEIFTSRDNTAVKTGWWTNFNYSYNVRLDHTGDLKEEKRSFGDLFWGNTRDSNNNLYLNEHHAGIKHSVGLNYNYKALGWLNLTQGFNYNEAWMDRDREENKWVRGRDYSAYSSANFTIYGIRNLPLYYVSTVRHIITPSASFNYSPGFKENTKFYSFGGIGVNSGGRSRSVFLNVDQRWQAKLRATDKQKERKLNDILSWSTRTGYNPDAKDKKFSNITHSINVRPGGWENSKLKLSYNAGYNVTHDPYQLHWLQWKMKSQYFSHSISLSGKASYTDYFPRAFNESFKTYLAPADTLGLSATEPDIATKTEGWELRISQDMSTDKNIIHPRYNNLRMNATVKVTTNWSLSYANYYNVTKSEMLSQSVDISRTLHCWKLNISYTRRNDYWDYRLVFFNMNLPDALRFQTRDSRRVY